MNPYVAELPWTDEQWSRIGRVVAEEAQRTRVAAKFLRIYGPVDGKELAVPNIEIGDEDSPLVGATIPIRRLRVNSLPQTLLTRISVLIYVRSHEAADPELQAALLMFQRAASLLARTEDALMFNGQRLPDVPPFFPGAVNIPAVVQVRGGQSQFGLVGRDSPAGFGVRPGLPGPGTPQPGAGGRPGWAFEEPILQPGNGVTMQTAGQELVGSIVAGINHLESAGYSGPYACVLANDLYQAVHSPNDNLVLPRHTIMPLLEGGPLLRSSTLEPGWGLLVSHESGQMEQVLASDISVKLLHVSEEPRFVFRMSERVALRVKDWQALVNFHP